MELFFVIGNLGSDAEYKCENGSEFIKFNVAETRRWTDANHVQHEETIWNSCIMHGKNEKLLPFLTKGTKVFVMGRGSTRVYSSPKERRMVAGINISVDRVELIGASSDPVGRDVVSADGCIYPVTKLYYIGWEQARNAGATEQQPVIFYDKQGNASFLVDYNGFVTRIQLEQPALEQQPQQQPQQQESDAPFIGNDNPAMINEKAKNNG